MKIAHCSDIHLDHCSAPKVLSFCDLIDKSDADCVVITGDISNGKQIINHLTLLTDNIKVPICFTTGNHCYWGSSFDYTNKEIETLCNTKNNLIFLNNSPVIRLTEKVALIGCTGWYDLENGSYKHSGFFPRGFPDFRFISDFMFLSPQDKKDLCVKLTTEAADFLEKQLLEALSTYNHIYLGTHVPPYWDASWHLGKRSDEEGAPFFSNKIIGERLNNIMEKHPDKLLTILTGHSHSEQYCRPISNVEVYTANAEYGQPSIYKIFQL